MTPGQVREIVNQRSVPHPTETLQLIETHASWVLLGDSYVYKIKKPMHFSFLDFSTLDKRKACCEMEVELNRRLAPGMYLGVLPVIQEKDQVSIGKDSKDVVDYAVWMRRMDEGRQLDLLMDAGKVSSGDIRKLAEVLARFHLKANPVMTSETWKELYEVFADLSVVQPYLEAELGIKSGALIPEVNQWVRDFLFQVQGRIEERKEEGFIIDGHGDLHCRNIFLLDVPIIFDCIEFSEELRTLDMLNEAAFLCMDLERFGRQDLARVFMDHYEARTRVIQSNTDRQLFLYFKMYRANVRLKVHCLHQLEGASGGQEKEQELKLISRYFELFREYYLELQALRGRIN